MVLIAVPPAVVMTIGPVVAPGGTVAVTCVSESTEKFVAATPSKATAVVCVRLTPVIRTCFPTGPFLTIFDELRFSAWLS